MKDFKFRQGMMTICNFYKILKSPVSYDVSTITRVNLKSQTSRYDELLDEIPSSFQDFLDQRKIPSFQLNSSQNPLFVTPKASAQGSNAIGITSIKDAIACESTGIIETQRTMASMVFTKEAYAQ